MAALIQELHERGGFLRESDAYEGIQRECRVTDPGVAVIPITSASHAFRKAAGRGGHNRPGGLKREEFQNQGGAVDHLTPAALIGTLANPGAPIVHRFLEEAIAFRL